MRLLAFAIVAAAASVALPALALTQPNGTPIPQSASLQTLFDGRGEAISALADAATTPETFTPSCGLTFEVLQRNAGYKNSFGWYNVTGTKPTPAELHEFLSCNDGVGTVKVLQIKSDPAYAGGEIGFYQAAGPGCPTAAANQNLFFSQKAYNPDGSMANPFIHLLTYNSTATPKAFYFAWEDLLSGGDNDFDDLTTFVTGITCTGGGAPCDTGLLGVCAVGTMQCQSGVLTCVQQVQPQTEACDGFDNDCNDQIDEGDLCPNDQVCDKGTCVPKCSSGEFPCTGGTICDANGLCVDPLCASVNCPSGQKCVAGQCIGPCDNVVCPFHQVCQLGVCVDPCGPITCDADQVCESGVCVDKCPCKTCGASETCLTDGHCIDTACATVTCNAGMHCEAGTCIDDCTGVTCPMGQACQAGQCVTVSGQGGAGGSSAAGLTTSSGGLVTSTGTSAGGASGTGAGTGGGGSGPGIVTSVDGCGCSVPGDDPSSPIALLGLAGVAYAAARRRRSGR